MTVKHDDPIYKKFESCISSNDYGSAYNILKKNPMLQIDNNDTAVLLNNLNELAQLDGSNNDPQREQQLVRLLIVLVVIVVTHMSSPFIE